MAQCTKCGAPMNEGAKFCTSCGQAVAHAVAGPPPPTYPAEPFQPVPPTEVPVPEQPAYPTEPIPPAPPAGASAPPPAAAPAPASNASAAPNAGAAPGSTPPPPVQAAPSQPGPMPGAMPPPRYATVDTAPPPGSIYTPVSVGGFFLMDIVVAIPIVGFILLLVWAFGSNVNRKNWARARLLFAILVILLVVGISLLVGGSALAILDYIT